MPIKISGHFMCLETGGQVIATARQRAGSCWEVSHWPWVCDRNQAITALTAAPDRTGQIRIGGAAAQCPLVLHYLHRQVTALIHVALTRPSRCQTDALSSRIGLSTPAVRSDGGSVSPTALSLFRW